MAAARAALVQAGQTILLQVSLEKPRPSDLLGCLWWSFFSFLLPRITK